MGKRAGWLAASLIVALVCPVATNAEEPAPAKEPAATPVEQPEKPTKAIEQTTQSAAIYNIKLREIDERVADLKEKIFLSKARLMALQEVILNGAITGAKTRLVFKNEMGSSFKIVRLDIDLDGSEIVSLRSDTKAAKLDQKEFDVYNGSITPGAHQVSVFAEYQGDGYGIFNYFADYKFKVKATYTFNAEEGRLTTVKVYGYEKGGITTPLKDRPSVRYEMEVMRELRSSEKEAPHKDNAGPK